MNMTLKKWQKKALAIFSVIAILFFAVMELGTLIPSLGIPSWEELFVLTDLSASPSSPEGTMEVHVLDVGNADCVLVRQGDMTMLIDAGERGDGDDILKYFQYHGIKKLDVVIATHAHADHVGSMAKLIRKLPVGQMILAFMPQESTPTSATYLDMLEALDECEVPVTEAKPGTAFALGDATVYLLAPLKPSDDANAMSVVSYIVFGDNRFLFMGDAEKDVEEDLLATGWNLSADVLKVGHHGSKTATTNAFLQKVSPTYAVITCQEGNSYGHPHQEVLERLDSRNVKICRTDLLGNMLFLSDGKTVNMSYEGIDKE